MSESQSRYGIMEELNNRKIAEKEKLANLEQQTDNTVFNMETDIQKLHTKIEEKKKTYKFDHRETMRQLEVNLNMLNSEYNRKKIELEEIIDDEGKNYEQRFKVWETNINREIGNKIKELKQYEKQQKKKIASKKAVIEEIENGITSLKELSKEQKSD